MDNECPLCKDMYRNPKTLPCLHSFCLECLDIHLQKSDFPNCPICRSVIEVPVEGLESLPVNPYIQNLVQYNQGSKMNDICEICEEKAPQSYCLQCQQYFCEGCQKAHRKSKVSLDHKFAAMTLTESETQEQTSHDRKVFCQKHEKKIIELYCSDCHEGFCIECLSFHPGHDICSIYDVKIDFIDQIKDLLKQTEPKSKELKSRIEKIDQEAQNLEINVAMTEKDIVFYFEKIQRVLEESQAKLFSELEKIKHAKKKNLSLAKKELEFSVESLQGCYSLTNKILNEGSHVEILLSKNQLISRLKSLQSEQLNEEIPQDSFIKFIPLNEKELLSSISHFGEIEIHKAAPECCLIETQSNWTYPNEDYSFLVTLKTRNDEIVTKKEEGLTVEVKGPMTLQPIIQENENGSYLILISSRRVGIYQVRVLLRGASIQGSPFNLEVRKRIIPSQDYNQLQLQKTFGKKGLENGEFKHPYSVTTNSFLQIIVTDTYNHRIQVFSQKGQFLFKFGSQGKEDGEFNSPNAIAVDANDNIIVADSGNNRIQKFDPNGKFLLKIEGLKQPSAIGIDGHDQIFVSEYISQIQVFSPNGEFRFKFGAKGSGVGELATPSGIAITSNGNIIVSEFGNHRIQIFDQNGKYLKMFGTKGKLNGQLLHPYQMVLDSQENLLVADSNNNRIQVFDSNGFYLAQFGQGKLNYPTSIAINQMGTIYVPSVNGFNVSIF